MSYWDSFATAANAQAPTGLSYTPGGTLDPNILKYYQNNPAFSATYQVGTPITANGYQIRPEYPVYDGQGDSGAMPSNTASGYSAWDGKSDKYQRYDANGNYQGDYAIDSSSPWATYGWIIPAAFSGGALAGVGGLGAGAAAEGGFGAAGAAGGAGITGFGDAGLMYGGLDAGAAGSLGGGASVLGGSSLGSFGAGTAAMGAGAEGLGGASDIFNPAVDSQLASTQLGITGSQAAADAAAAQIPSVSLSNFVSSNPGVWQTLTDKLGSSGATDFLKKLGSAASSMTGSSSGDFNWGSLIGPLLSTIGGVAGYKAAGDAADAQLQAAREAAALNEPFRQNGLAAGNKMMQMLGIGGDTTAADYGSLSKPFTYTDLTADPGYQFRLDQGQKALTRQLSAGGSLYSGKALKDMQDYTQGQASQEFQNAFNRDTTTKTNDFNRLASVYGSGQTAANTVGNYTTQAGNAQAAGTVGQANALTNAIGQGYSMYSNNELLNRLLQPRS